MLDVLVVLVTGCLAAAFVATSVMVSLLAAVGKTGGHEFCAFFVVVCSRLPLASVVVMTAPITLATWFYGSFTALVEYGVLPIIPFIGNLHEMGDGLGFYPAKRLLKLQLVDASSEHVYHVVFGYSFG